MILYAIYVGNRLPNRTSWKGMPPVVAMQGRKVNFKHDLPTAFCDYLLVKVSGMRPEEPQAVGALALLPRGTPNAAVQCLNLATGRIMTTHNYEIQPMPQDVVVLMNRLAESNPLPSIDKEILVDVTPMDEGERAEVAQVIKEFQTDKRPLLPVNQESQEEVAPTTVHTDPLQDRGADELTSGPGGPHADPETETEAVPDLVHDEDDDDTSPTVPDIRGHPYDLRTRRSRHVYLMQEQLGKRMERLPKAPSSRQVNRVFQLSLRKAMKNTPESAIKAATLEVLQMYDKSVYQGVLWQDIPEQHRDKVIPSFMFLRDKFGADGAWEKLKARLVAGGNFQIRDPNDPNSSPTASTASIFALATLAAAEGRSVATMDIGGAYLNADMSGDNVYMKLDSRIAAINTIIDPAFKRFVRPDGTALVKVLKALYGCVQSGKLWYKHFSEFLLSLGFERNPVEECVFNKVDDQGNAITLALFVDDLFIAANDPDDIAWLHRALRDQFGEVTFHEGLVHSYLGMEFDFRKLGQVEVSMRGYIDKVLEEWTDYLHGQPVTTPAAESIFQVRDSPALGPEHRKKFHHTVAQLLYLENRIKPELAVAIGFLTTRVQCSSQDDWRKLIRVVRYVSENRDVGIILRPGGLGRLVAYIDASYGTHPDGKSHSGSVVMMGAALQLAKSQKQKIVTKSSAESEYVALSDMLGEGFHLCEFWKGLGYDLAPLLVYQDNQAAMALAAKGKSTSSRTKHIAIRYFWIKERIDSGEVELEYLPTQQMLADLLTKPLQGELFVRLRDTILGQDVDKN